MASLLKCCHSNLPQKQYCHGSFIRVSVVAQVQLVLRVGQLFMLFIAAIFVLVLSTTSKVTGHFVPRSFRTQVISYHFGHFVPTFIFNLVISYPVWSFRTYFYYSLENRFGHFVPIFYFSYPSHFVSEVISYPF